MKILKRSIGFLLIVAILVSSLSGALFAEAASDFKYTVKDGKATITGYAGAGGDITTPSTLAGYPVTAIGGGAFAKSSYFDTKNNNITGVTISEGVTSIGNGAFRDCINITSISIPQGVSSIGNEAFSGCEKLTSISVPYGVKEIPKSAFRNCKSLSSISIPEGVTIIGGDAFWACQNLSNISIPSTVKRIEWSAFIYCTRLTSINIPQGVGYIDESTFEYCSSLRNITLPQGITGIGWKAFRKCTNLTSISIPSTVLRIDSSAFENCTNLSSVIVSQGVREIKSNAFSGCTNLTSIVIPSTVTSIGDLAFSDCKKLTIYGMPGSKAQIYSDNWGIQFEAIKTAAPTKSNVLINGNSVAFQAYNIDNSNYFKLRDLAKVLSSTDTQFDVGWDSENNAIRLTTGSSYTIVGGELVVSGNTTKITAMPTMSKVYLNGNEITIKAYNIGDNNYFKLRDVAAAINFGVAWDESTSTIKIDTSMGYTA